jgi:hypothetical protein
MSSDRTNSDRARVSGDPHRPAYDNPVGNKGELVAGNNVLPKQRHPSAEPQGRKSDKKLGRKPAG